MDTAIGIDELAAAAGITRRAVRFYVQQKLLPPPLGVGRGRHYDRSHLERLREILALQSAGHSLEAIRRLAAGQSLPTPPPLPRRRHRPAILAQVWTRMTLADGVELSFDTAKHQPDAAGLVSLVELVRQVFTPGDKNDPAPPTTDDVPNEPPTEPPTQPSTDPAKEQP